uniref:Uncharacterized protein n=1 Tax=Ditylenchus dipsaci TaxID=166011 RepID=A0A915DRA0_9BILA
MIILGTNLSDHYKAHYKPSQVITIVGVITISGDHYIETGLYYHLGSTTWIPPPDHHRMGTITHSPGMSTLPRGIPTPLPYLATHLA